METMLSDELITLTTGQLMQLRSFERCHVFYGTALPCACDAQLTAVHQLDFPL